MRDLGESCRVADDSAAREDKLASGGVKAEQSGTKAGAELSEAGRLVPPRSRIASI